MFYNQADYSFVLQKWSLLTETNKYSRPFNENSLASLCIMYITWTFLDTVYNAFVLFFPT